MIIKIGSSQRYFNESNSSKVQRCIKDIRQAKERLKNPSTHEFGENFGQREVRILRDKYLQSSDYYEDSTPDEKSELRALIDDFDEWCMTYTPIYEDTVRKKNGKWVNRRRS